jgi:hypothetical protein
LVLFFLGFFEIQALESRHEILFHFPPAGFGPAVLSGALNAAMTGDSPSRYCPEGSSY